MKKLFLLFVVLALIAGCNKENIYKDDLKGVWQVYKYLFKNSDKSQQFQNTFQDYTIAFTADGKFTETYRAPAPDTGMYVISGTYSFADNDVKLVLDNNYNTYSLDSIGDTITTTHAYERKFTIFNLTKNHVQLRTDSSELYMNKK